MKKIVPRIGRKVAKHFTATMNSPAMVDIRKGLGLSFQGIKKGMGTSFEGIRKGMGTSFKGVKEGMGQSMEGVKKHAATLTEIEHGISTAPQHKKSLRHSLVAGAFDAIMVGLTDSFLIPFFLALQAPVLMIGLVKTLPSLIASFFQLLTKPIQRIFKSRKRISLVMTVMESIVLMPLVILPHILPVSSASIWLYFLCVVLYSVFAMMFTPFWSSWIGDMVEESRRGAFFAKRNKLIAISNFLSYLVSGFILTWLSSKNILLGFSAVFLLALLSELCSGIFVSKMDELPIKGEQESSVTFLKFLKKIDTSEFGRFVFGASIFRWAVYIGSPFIAMYLLNDLHFTYMQFTLIMLTPSVASFLTINQWGKLCDKIGTKRITVIGAYLIGISSIMWLFSKDFKYIFIINVINGIGWAAFNLASSNYVFDASMREEVVSYSAYYNLFLGVAVVLGGITGGLEIDALGITVLGSAALFVILASGVLRLVTTTLFIVPIKEARLVEVRGANKNFVLVNPSKVFAWQSTQQNRSTIMQDKLQQTLNNIPKPGEKYQESVQKERDYYNKIRQNMFKEENNRDFKKT